MVARRREIEDDPDLDPGLRETLVSEWQQQAALRCEDGITEAREVANQRLHPWLLPACVAITTLAAYAAVGDLSAPALRFKPPSASAPPLMARDAPPRPGENHPGGKGSVEERIDGLEKKLRSEPDNLEGWVTLARSRGLQRNYPAAVKALERALQLAPGHPDILADLADATAMMQGESMAGRPMQLVAEALKSDPRHQKSIALAATGAMQAGQSAEAIKLWRALQSQFLPGDPDYDQIDRILSQLGESGSPLSSGDGTAQRSSQSSPTGPASGKPSPPTAATAASPSIRGEVLLARDAIERLRQRSVPASAVLYVVAKAVDGPPMPLAVLRLPITELVAGRPLAFQLDDSLAMSPQLKLSQFRQVSVEARLSMSGNAIRQSEDWSVVRSPVAVGSAGLSLRIEPAAGR